LRIILSKQADLLAKLYDLYHAQVFQENTPLYALYLGDLSRILYYGYVFEKYDLWNKLFDTLIGKINDYEASRYLRELEGISIYRWDLLEAELELFSKKLLETYNKYMVKARDMIRKVLGVREFFNEEYVILAFNPHRGLIGSAPRINLKEKYIVISLFIGPDSKPEKTLDLYIHELLHGLIRLNNIEISEDVEEEFINTLCPEGYLSRELGLTSTLNISESNLQILIASYFDNKLYERIDLLTYLRDRSKLHYI
jgi:hypothetical protein